MGKPVLLTVDDDPGVSRAVARDSQLDRVPHQWIDLHDGLDATLVMLARKHALIEIGDSGPGVPPEIAR